MAIYNDFLGAAEIHDVEGGIQHAFTKNAGHDLGQATNLDITSIDPGYNPGGHTFG